MSKTVEDVEMLFAIVSVLKKKRGSREVVMCQNGVARSSTFIRLERKCGDIVQMVDFHTVVNGNRYYREKESHGWLGEIQDCNEKLWNMKWEACRKYGYKVSGLYEMDIYGHEMLLKKIEQEEWR